MKRARVYLSGVQADVPCDFDPRFVGSMRYSPEFFGWAIPTGIGRVRIGLCGITDVCGKFKTFVQQSAQSGACMAGDCPLGPMPRRPDAATLFPRSCAGFATLHQAEASIAGAPGNRHAAAIARPAHTTGSTIGHSPDSTNVEH